MKVILVIFVVMLFGMSTANATTTAILHLDQISNVVNENGIVIFSGQMTTSNGIPVSNHTIFIKNDSPLGTPDVILEIAKTNENGKFSTSWKAVYQKDVDYEIYAVYLGGNTYGYTRSETNEVYIKPLPDTNHNLTSPELPAWLKEISNMWYGGQVKDKRFAYGIENLVDQQIIREQNDAGSMHIPQWLKTNAGLYGKGEISDDEFLNSIQYVIDQHIMKP